MYEFPRMHRWGQIPEQYRKMGSAEFSKMPLREAQVAVSPGLVFGANGGEYVRFALIGNNNRTKQAIRGLKKVFSGSSTAPEPAGEADGK